MPQSKVDEIVLELREYSRWLDGETRRVTRALAVLTDDEDDVDDESRSLSELLTDAFRQSRAPLSISEAHNFVRHAGWTTESKDPVNVVRAALARMAAQGELRRLTDKRGFYALVTDDLDDVETGPSDTDLALIGSRTNPWTDQTATEDPWNAPARANPFKAVNTQRAVTVTFDDEEPPF